MPQMVILSWSAQLCLSHPSTMASTVRDCQRAFSISPSMRKCPSSPTNTSQSRPIGSNGYSEMSLGIFGATGHSVLHTLVTTRSLKILYFDGQSATSTETGALDSQIALLQGEIPSVPTYNLIYDEEQRALDLCDLVRELGIDGVVRMNAGFEILLCDWPQAGVQELFSSNHSLPGNRAREEDKSLPHDPNRQPPLGFGNAFGEQSSFEWLRSATWHYGSHGQGGPAFQQVKVYPCRMVSFYDPELSSLVGLHEGCLVGNQTFQNGWGLRRGHRIAGATASPVLARLISRKPKHIYVN